jgi:Protein of unknown function (DUF1570)
MHRLITLSHRLFRRRQNVGTTRVIRRLASSMVVIVALGAPASLLSGLAPQPQSVRTEGERRMQRSWWDRTDPGRGALPSSRFYQLRSDLSPADTRAYGHHLDLLYVEYKRRMGGLEQRTPEVLNVLMFATQQDYINTLRERYGINGMGSGGMFFVSPRGAALAFWVEGLPRSRVEHVIQHEGFHQFAHSRFGADLPPWANEGVAEFFGESAVVDGAVILGQTSERTLKTLRAAIDESKHIRFRDMITMDLDRWNANVQSGSAALQYMQAWSMVHFLVYGEGGKYQKAFEAYLGHINRGAKNYEAFVRAFGTDDLDSFEARWIEHAKTARVSSFLTALERIQFLAEGMRALAAKGMVPTDLEDLRTKLIAEKFTSQVFTGGGAHGTTTTLSADDHYNFQIPDDDLAPGTPTFEVVASKTKRTTRKPREGDDTIPVPPGIVTQNLAPKNIAVRWSRSKDGRTLDFALDLLK